MEALFTCHCNEYPLVLTYASNDCHGLTFVRSNRLLHRRVRMSGGKSQQFYWALKFNTNNC